MAQYQVDECCSRKGVSGKLFISTAGIGAGVVLQWMKPLFGILTSHIRVPGQVLATLLLFQLHANASGK